MLLIVKDYFSTIIVLTSVLEPGLGLEVEGRVDLSFWLCAEVATLKCRKVSLSSGSVYG